MLTPSVAHPVCPRTAVEHSGRSMTRQTGVEDEAGDHPGGEAEGHLDHAVAQLAEVIHERHAALGLLLPLRVHEALADNAGTRDSTGEFRHDRFPP